MLHFSRCPDKIIKVDEIQIPVFLLSGSSVNTDQETVDSFGEEWTKFSTFTDNEIKKIGSEYFDIVDEKILNKDHVVLDLGCGTGRWSKFLADKVKFIEAVDPSSAIFSAAKLLNNMPNVRAVMSDIDNLPYHEESFDFAISLGVLHHIPNTRAALRKLVKKVKLNGHVLIYLYYNLENRSSLYRLIFRMTDFCRRIISKLPTIIKIFICETIAFLIYVPLIYSAKAVQFMIKGNFYHKFPLSYYTDKSLWIIRNDALDRFGTPVEQRFSKDQILKMMEDCGLDNICFSTSPPYWHATGQRII